MSHPAALLAIANTCHADMHPRMRAETIRTALASLGHPSVASLDVPRACDAEFAMSLLDILEQELFPVPLDDHSPFEENERGTGKEPIHKSLYMVMLVVVVLGVWCLSLSHTKK